MGVKINNSVIMLWTYVLMLASQTLHTVVFINKYIALASAPKHTQPVSVPKEVLLFLCGG